MVFQFGYSRRTVQPDEAKLIEKHLRDLCPLPDYQAACELARAIRSHMLRPEQHSTVVVDELTVEMLLRALELIGDDRPLGRTLNRLRQRAEEVASLL